LVPPNVGSAHDLDKVKAAMTLLKSKVEKPGPAKIERTDAVAGKSVPAVYFASAKQDDKFDVVEEVAKEAGEPPRSSSIAG
jgi:hypothetical protein